MKTLIAVSELGLIPTATHTVTQQVLSGELLEIGQVQGVYEELILLTAKRKISNSIANKLATSFSI